MVIDEKQTTFISQIFDYMDDSGVIPDNLVDVVTGVIDVLAGNNGPDINLVYNSELNGYQVSYDGTVYGKDQQDDLLTAWEGSSYATSSLLTGSLSVSSDGEQYSAAHLAELLGTNTINLPVTYGSNSVRFPGTNAVIHIEEGSWPSINILVGPYSVSLVGPYEAYLEKGISASELDALHYLNYQIKKSNDGDVIFKCCMSASPYGTDFDGLSINQYCTSNKYIDNDPPLVCHGLDGYSGGFALLQYDTAMKSEIDLSSGNYNYGICLMNQNGAPLIYITNGTSGISRSDTTSLYNLGGTSLNEENERMLSPNKSSHFPTSVAALAPIITPSSGANRSQRSKWLCSGHSDYYDGCGKFEAGFTEYHNDHGLCLSGGVSE